jgi:hypothetical protein
MVETITPAVCGTRKRQLLALSLFAVGAVAAAAGLGALLGLAGSAIGRGPALAVALALAVLGALREAGVVRFAIPQSKRQVPERWRFELPLPVWSLGYGAGLGVGVLTYQPVATFWVACAAALALGRPVAGALAFALYGVGRTAGLLLSARRGVDATAVVEGLAGRRPTLLRANAVALAVCACLLAAAPVAGADVIPLGPGSQFDPSRADTGFAYTQRTGGASRVVVRPAGGGSPVELAGGESPSLYGRLLAYQDAQGIRVVRWTADPVEEVRRFNGTFSKPALGWPWLVYRKDHEGDRHSLYLRNLRDGTVRRLATGGEGVEIGRPSILGDRIAWHVAGEHETRIVLYRISTGRRAWPLRSEIALLSNPALSGRYLLWTRDLPNGSTLFARRLGGGRARRVAWVWRPRSSYWFWTTDGQGRTAFVTRWNTASGVARILRKSF